ncbi:MAG: hypothetical protein P8J27_01980 [Mariniblastus sp.]|nr:hypothetical protein [Mariniblastus sp.]
MWRTILLGKLSLSILASLVVGVACVSQPWRHEYALLGKAQWIGVGSFFLVLALVQIGAIFVLFHKGQSRKKKCQS